MTQALAAKAENIAASHRWFAPFLRQDAMRALFSVTVLEQLGELDAARLWLDALAFDVKKDTELESGRCEHGFPCERVPVTDERGKTSA